jgi:hypothetical protein
MKQIHTLNHLAKKSIETFNQTLRVSIQYYRPTSQSVWGLDLNRHILTLSGCQPVILLFRILTLEADDTEPTLVPDSGRHDSN